ncbi:UNKNOWN [Stylonychia lemnae]|uniref:Uncharacterized protein n=1 Tax=Stylonychia lemnae TaxID=5949 RepID=A0A078AK91_STYLE|nr:UNKNOWN [Stylonychia lemnae]|eukprot:CDW82604.1 UNKNOWN [Stylonychia lemnae]
MTEIKESHKGTIGVLLVDNLGLPIESQGNFDKNLSGIVSSIMKNAARLEKILNQSGDHRGSSADITAKVYFNNENLVIRHKQGLTLAVRQAN